MEKTLVIAGLIILGTIIIFKATIKTIKIAIPIIGAVIMLMYIAGCGSNNEVDKKEIERESSIVKVDNETVSMIEDETNIGGVARDTEYEAKIDELNSKQEVQGNEEEVYSRIREEFTNYGVGGEVTFSDKQYISEDTYIVYGENVNTNMLVSADVNVATGEINVGNSGSINGSDYMLLNNVSQLRDKLSELEELLFICGISSSNMASISNIQDNTMTVTIDGTEYNVDLENKKINGRGPDEWVNK